MKSVRLFPRRCRVLLSSTIAFYRLFLLVLMLFGTHHTFAAYDPGHSISIEIPTAAPKIGLSKRVVQTSFNTNGSFDVTFEFTLQNFGTVDLTNVQVTDNLAATFSGTCAATVKALTSATYVVNTGFNGLGDVNLLKPGSNTLPVNGKGYILLTVTVANCNGAQTGPGCDPDQDGLSNAQETAFGTNPALADTDKNGVADGLQIAGLCNGTTINALLPGLAAEVAAGCMTRVRVVASKGKQYAELRYRNAAQCPVNRPMTWFDCNGQAYCNDGGGVTFPTCDPSFFGDMSIVKTIYQYGVNTAYFDPQPACPVQLSFSSTANAVGYGPNGQQTMDASTDGANPDPNGNGDPIENNPTMVGPLTPKAQIGLAQRLVQSSLQPDGSTLLAFEFVLKNLGNVHLGKITLVDDLAAVFPAACAFSVTGVTSADLVPNLAFNGKNNNNLLSSNNDLPVGKQALLQLQLRVWGCGSASNNLSNTATATGIGLSGMPYSDISGNGTNPDPDGDGNANEPGENDPTPFNLSCWVGIQCPANPPASPVPNDAGRCTATLVLPAAVPMSCPGAPAALVEYRLSGAGAEGLPANTWMAGQPGSLAYRVGTTKVEWRASIPAMSWLGYSDVCAIDLTVADKQAPQLQAGVNLPGDLTLSCNAVPVATVLVASQLRDNCTAAAGLGITYNEVSTQCADQSQCCHYTYTLLRTWRVTDQSGNTFVHTQKIQVADNSAPLVQCKDKTLVLSTAGTATLMLSDLNAGIVDNCGAAGNLTLSLSKTAFGCSEVGDHTVLLRATDVCGNSGSCSAKVSVVHPPAPIHVKSMIELTLDAACQYELTPGDVLVSNYPCFNSYLVTIDKTMPYGDGPWESPKLGINDLGKPYVFRLLHPQTWNVAYGSLMLRDRAVPGLTCPPDLTIQCNESQQTARTGVATFADCQTATLTTSDVFQDQGQCANPRALLLRTFTASDPSGNQSKCTQRIAIAPFSPVNIVFPADVTLDCQAVKNNPTATEPAQTGMPTQQGLPLYGMPLCGSDVFYTDTPTDPCDGTYGVIRVWNVLNKCAVLGPNNPLKATQTIRIVNKGTPVVTACAKPDTCDRSDNDPGLWNLNVWWDQKHLSHDLSEMPVDLKTTITDSCGGTSLQVAYFLWLDLDNNGVAETVVSSADLPPDNTVFYGNANNPGFTGGEARAFDQRFGVDPALDRYRFALQVVRSGSQVTAALRFNTLRQPNNYVLPQLPHGKHKIRWVVNVCGKESVCESTFNIQDCLAPTVRCKPMSTSLQQGGMVTVSANDFYESIVDNCSPANLLKMGLTSEYLSHGLFPRDPVTLLPLTTVTLSCADLGSNVMQLWGEDVSGNSSFCAVVLFLQDPLGKCGNNNLAASEASPDDEWQAAMERGTFISLPGKRSNPGEGSAQMNPLEKEHFELYQNQPNPFDEETLIGFYLPEAGEVVLTVFDLSGALVYRETTFLDRGHQQVVLGAAQLPASGLLYYRVETALGAATRKMLRLR